MTRTHSFCELAGTCRVPPKQDRRGRGAQHERDFLSRKPRPVGGKLHISGHTTLCGGLPESYDFEKSLCIASQHLLHVSGGDIQRFEASQVPPDMFFTRFSAERVI